MENIQRIDELVHQLEEISDPNIRSMARELVQLLMEMHGQGLERILDKIWQKGTFGSEMIDELGRDEIVGPLLLLYNLHPLDLQTRVLQALDKVRPYLKSHGGNVEFLDLDDDGVVRLKLEGSCHGCPSSSITMKLAIEEAIYQAAPDITNLLVEGVVQSLPKGFVPLGKLKPKSDAANWEEVGGLESLSAGQMKTMDVHGRSVLFCRLGDNMYAYGSTCPGCSNPLNDAYLVEPNSLVCRACSRQYDAVKAGRGVDQPDLHLEPVPLLHEHGHTKIALINP